MKIFIIIVLCLCKVGLSQAQERIVIDYANFLDKNYILNKKVLKKLKKPFNVLNVRCFNADSLKDIKTLPFTEFYKTLFSYNDNFSLLKGKFELLYNYRFNYEIEYLGKLNYRKTFNSFLFYYKGEYNRHRFSYFLLMNIEKNRLLSLIKLYEKLADPSSTVEYFSKLESDTVLRYYYKFDVHDILPYDPPSDFELSDTFFIIDNSGFIQKKRVDILKR